MTVQTSFVEGAENQFQIVRTQDVEPILEMAKALNREGAGNGKDDKHAAEFPLVLVERYLVDNNVSWNEFLHNPVHVKRMCNDPALKHFRIWQGAL